MDVTLRDREKCQAHEVPVGQCLKEIKRARCLQVIDLTQADMFREPKDEGSKLVLRDDVVYVVDVATGVVDIIPKNQDVYRVNLVAQEIS